MGRGTTIVDRLNKLSGKDATTIPKALEYLEEEGIGGDVDWNINDPEAKGYISNRPFYEYDDFEDEECWDFAEEFTESIEFTAKTFRKRTNESGLYYEGSPYRFNGTKRPTTHLFRDIFEEGKAYKVKLFFDSEIFPEMEYIYIPSVYGNEVYPVSTAFDTVSFPTDYGDFVCFYHAKVGSQYAAIAACKFYVAGADDGSQADPFPDTLTFTNLKVYKLKPVKKVKKIDEKYLPIKGLNVHICTSEEYDSSTHVPTVTNPDASTLYLVPTSSKSKNMFDEYIWTGTDWEKFGTGSVALPSPTTADNGKVLGVDGGEYKLVEQSGGEIEQFSRTSEYIRYIDGNTLHLGVQASFSLSEQATPNTKLLNIASYIPSDIKDRIRSDGPVANSVGAFHFSGGPTTPSVEYIPLPISIQKLTNSDISVYAISGTSKTPLLIGSWSVGFECSIPLTE